MAPRRGALVAVGTFQSARNISGARGLHWSSYAAQLSVGRMFIAGDAAHIHSPFGGQEMNIGLHDVWNLARRAMAPNAAR